MIVKKYLLKHNPKIMFDGDYISRHTIHEYNISPAYYSVSIRQNGDYRYKLSFVGIKFNRNNKVIISFPKRFTNNFNIHKYYIKYLQKVIKVLLKYTKSKNYSQYNSGRVFFSFPFMPFFNIYNFYLMHGIYNGKKFTISKKGHGKLLWNVILEKSTKIIDNHNLIFKPLYYRSKRLIYNFISYCMVYSINHTIDMWEGIVPSLPHKIFFPFNINVKLNYSIILIKLKKIYNITFNDSIKFLVSNLIWYFSNVNFKFTHLLSIKCYNYSSIWEEIVRKYLKDCFNGIKINSSYGNLQLNFLSKSKSIRNKFYKPVFYYNLKETIKGKNKGLHFQPDFYLRSCKYSYTYIFDAKYYNNIKKTDYKQISYEFLLSRLNKGRQIFNVLFIPSRKQNNCTDPFFILDPIYNPLCQKVALYVCHLNSIKVTNHFINEDE